MAQDSRICPTNQSNQNQKSFITVLVDYVDRDTEQWNSVYRNMISTYNRVREQSGNSGISYSPVYTQGPDLKQVLKHIPVPLLSSRRYKCIVVLIGSTHRHLKTADKRPYTAYITERRSADVTCSTTCPPYRRVSRPWAGWPSARRPPPSYKVS